MTEPALSPAAAMATQAVAVPPDSHAFVGRLPLSLFLIDCLYLYLLIDCPYLYL